MNCNDIRKLIHQSINGELSPSLFAEHLESCPECRAYYERMLRQKELLATLSPKDAPQFDLLSAKRRKKAQSAKKLRRLSAAAAVFVAVIITGSLILFPRGGSNLAETEGSILFDQAMDAPAADAPAEGAPAEEPAANEPVAEEPAADAPAADAPADDTMCYETTESQTESDIGESYAIAISLPQDEYDKLQKALEDEGFQLEPDEFGFYIHRINSETVGTLSRLLAPYTDQSITENTDMILIQKN